VPPNLPPSTEEYPATADSIAQRLQEDPLFRQRYTLGRVLGEGGFGRVFEARQTATDQKVAIKAVSMNLGVLGSGSTATRIERFEREVRLCARVHHPNIVRLIDAGSVMGKLMYAVFEFVPGQTLEHVLAAEGALIPDEAMHLMTQVLDGLCCAHRSGIFHRDIKPANIMLTSTGLRRNALVLDFGIGVLVDPSMADEREFTGDYHFVGTPRYAAPEQLRGEVLTPRADLYAWALTFLEVLLGRPVFEGRSLAHLMIQKQDGEIELPEDLAKSALGKLLLLSTRSDVLDRNVTVEGLYAALASMSQTSLRIPVPQRASAGSADLDLTDADEENTIASFAAQKTFSPGTLATERRGLSSLAIHLTVTMSASPEGGPNLEELYDSLIRTMRDLVVGKTYREGGSLAGHVGTRFLLHFAGSKRGQGGTQRATRVAFQILQTVARFSERLHHTRGWRVEAGASLVHGLGIARTADGAPTPSGFPISTVYMPTDATVVELAACARPGTLVVSGEVTGLLGDEYSTVRATLEREPALADVPETFEVLARTRTEAVEREEHAMPLVGRLVEMGTLRALAERMLSDRGQAVIVSGEPGFGKSRLVAALRDEFVDRCPTWLETACATVSTHTPLRAIVELLLPWAGILPRDPVEVAERKLEGLLARYGEYTSNKVALLLPLLLESATDTTEVEAARRLELTIEAICGLFVAAAEGSRRVVVVLEDIQWADPTTLRLIGELLPRVSECGLLLVLTARDGFDAPWPQELDATIRLGKLSGEEARAMIGGLDVPQAELPVEDILERADGVPLYVRELAIMAATTASGGSAKSLPVKLERVLDERLDAAGSAKRLAQLGAVFGREFRHDDLKAVAGLSEPELDAQLKALVDLRLLTRRRNAETSTYGFRHALVRDAAYASIVTDERRLMHALVGQQLVERDPTVSTTRPELLAEHLECAGQHGPAVGLLLAAGQLASRRAANVEAETHLRRGFAVLRRLPPGAEALQIELGLSLALCGTLMAKEGFSCTEIGTLFTRARSLVHELGLMGHLLPVLFGGGAFHVLRAELPAALELAQTAMALARGHSDDSLKLPAALFFGGIAYLGGDLAGGVGALEEGVAAYDPNLHRPLTQIFSYEPGIAARGYLALGLALTGRVDEAQRMLALNMEEGRAFGHAHTLLHVLIRASFIRTLLGQPELTLKLAEEAMAVAKEKGFPLWWANAAVFRGWARACLGDAAGLEDLRMGIDAWSATGAKINVPWFRTLLAEAQAKTGDLAAARATIASAVQEALASGEVMFLPESYRVQAEIAALAGHHDAARDALARGWESAQAQGARWLGLRVARLALDPPFTREGEDLSAARERLRSSMQAIAGGVDLPELRLGRAALA